MIKHSKFYLLAIAGIILLSLGLSGQAPQKFNFQAVARNSAGELIGSGNLDIRLSLYAKSDASLAWQETHTVTTSDLGIFTLDVGTGTRSGGSASLFSNIDWAGDSYSMKVELKEGMNWEDMGSSDLLSVPYALSAASVSNLKSLEVREDIANPVDSALFEVKNKDGNTVFAVYNEGVSVYVDDNIGKAKGSRGGFSVGGFDRAKGKTFDFLKVTPDSVRVYVDETLSKGSRGGFAVGGFDRAKGLTEEIMHLSQDNYFIGYESGSNITTGQYNSFFGYKAGVMNSIGSSNVFIGNETGYGNEDGNWNIFLGNNVGYSNTTGSGNIILGDYAGNSNTEGSFNVFLGDLSGLSNTTGSDNVYIGSDAGLSSDIADFNVFVGSGAGLSNTDGSSNVFLGESSGFNNISGNSNVFIGTESGLSNETGNNNVFIGEISGYSNTIGIDNVFLGASSGELNDNGSYNVFMGKSAGYANSSGSGNVYLGFETSESNSTGVYNVALGAQAGYSNLVGSNNVFLGFQSGYYEEGSNKLYIDNKGAGSFGALIYGEFDNNYLSFYADVDIWGNMFYYDLFGTSDGSLKTNISDVNPMLDKVKALRPVEFDWKPGVDIKGSTPEGRQLGLIAQEVEVLFPELVKANVKGQKAINYTKLTVVLLEALQEQQAIIEDQQNRLDQLESRMNSIMGAGK